jgi:prevent-host-death family protein
VTGNSVIRKPQKRLHILRKIRKLREIKGASMKQIPASEFARNFGQYREAVQREPVAVTSHGRTTGYFVSALAFEEYQKLKAMARRAYKVSDLPKSFIESLAATRVSPAHDHLNALLDDE